jgi:light-regulated signal transduction histidine kinase (bacteriophytochrome)
LPGRNNGEHVESMLNVTVDITGLEEAEQALCQKNIQLQQPSSNLNVVPCQFRQLFQNLVNKSLKFARRGVPPHIGISNRVVSGDLHLVKAARYLYMDVADSGIGFDNEYAGKIFAIFQRLHSKGE